MSHKSSFNSELSSIVNDKGPTGPTHTGLYIATLYDALRVISAVLNGEPGFSLVTSRPESEGNENVTPGTVFVVKLGPHLKCWIDGYTWVKTYQCTGVAEFAEAQPVKAISAPNQQKGSNKADSGSPSHAKKPYSRPPTPRVYMKVDGMIRRILMVKVAQKHLGENANQNYAIIAYSDKNADLTLAGSIDLHPVLSNVRVRDDIVLPLLKGDPIGKGSQLLRKFPFSFTSSSRSGISRSPLIIPPSARTSRVNGANASSSASASAASSSVGHSHHHASTAVAAPAVQRSEIVLPSFRELWSSINPPPTDTDINPY